MEMSYSNTELVPLVVLLHRNRDLLDLFDGEVGGSSESSDDGLRVETLLYIRLQLLQELGSQESDRGGTIPDLGTAGKKRRQTLQNISTFTYLKALSSPQHPGSVQCPPGSWLQDEPRPAV